MDDNDLADLADTLAELAAETPSPTHAVADPQDADQLIEAMRSLDSPAARRLRRALQDWQQAVRRLKSAHATYDRAEARMRQSCADVAAELRNQG